MHERLEGRVEDWRSEPFSDGYADLREMADEGFSGVVETDQGAWLCLLNGTVVGVFDGDIEEFDGASGTAYAAPEPSLPLLFAMLERGGSLEKQYYTNDTPISEAHETLSSGGFAGYLELSENVLSGDYYVCYYGDRSMSVGFVGSNDRLVTGEEAFDRADDEVGIYDVYSVDLEVVDVPDPDRGAGGDPGAGTDAGPATDAAGSGPGATSADDGAGADDRTGRADPVGGDDRRRTRDDPGGATARDREERRSTGVAADDRAGTAGPGSVSPGDGGAGTDAGGGDDGRPDDPDRRNGDPIGGAGEGVVDADGGDPLAPGTVGGEDPTPDEGEGENAPSPSSPSPPPESDETDPGPETTRDDRPERSTGSAPSGRRDARVGRDGRRERDREAGTDPEGDRDGDRRATDRDDARRESVAGGRTNADAESETDAGGRDGTDATPNGETPEPETSTGETDRPPADGDRRDSRSSGAADRAGDGRRSDRRREGRAADPGPDPGTGVDGRESRSRSRSPPGETDDRRPDDRRSGREDPESRGDRNGRSDRTDQERTGRPDRDREGRARSRESPPGGRGSRGDRARDPGDRRSESAVDGAAADRLREQIRRHESAIDRLRDRVATLEAADDAAEESVDRVRADVEELADDLGDLRRTVVRLDRTVDRIEDRIDGSTGADAGGTADRDNGPAPDSRDVGDGQPGADLATDTDAVPGGSADREGPDLTPEEALSETTVLVRYGSQGQATLETAHGGDADAETVDENLQLTTHTSFDASAATVDGRPYRQFLDERLELRFFRWLLREHFYEIRETGNADALGDLYDAVPQIDRAEFRGAVAVDAEEDGPEEVRFDLVARDGRDRPLVAMNFHDSRDPATEGMVVELQDRAKRVCATSDLAAAYLVATSYFEGAARDTAENATAGSLLSRSSKKSYLRVSRRRGFHLCLVAVSEGDFHLKLPEL